MKRFVLLLLIALVMDARAATLQERIDAAAPGENITLAPGVYVGPIVIDKPVTLSGNGESEICGNGRGKTVSIVADGVTVRGVRVTNSGLNLMEDDAALFVTGNNVVIENNKIAESLHGIYLKKVRNARVIGNRIAGKTTLPVSGEPVEKGIGQSAENCDTTLASNRRGNGIHQWNCEGNLIANNDIMEARDGIYFSFTNNSRVENNTIHHVRYGLHYMYSNDNVFVNNTFSENAAGAAVMFSNGVIVQDNHFVNNRGLRAYGLILQSTDNSRLERNEIAQNAVGLSFNQCNANHITANRVTQNYIGLKIGSNSGDNRFSENLFVRNLHPVETGGIAGSSDKWAVNGVGNRWDGTTEFDLDHDGVNDLPHHELDLFGVLRRDFPAVALLSDSAATRLLRFAQQRAALPGLSSIDDPSPLTSRFWNIRARQVTPRLTTRAQNETGK